MKKIKYFGLGFIILAVLGSCSKDQFEPTLDNEVTTEESVNTLGDIKLVAAGMYKSMRSSSYYGRDYIIYDEVRSDNAFSTGNSGRFVTVSEMNMVNTDSYAGNTFSAIYRPISNANIIINSNVTGDAAEINHTKGEAYAVRALCHFDLLKLYGQQHVAGQGGNNAPGIAYITQYKVGNVTPVRNTVVEVKQKIYADLDAAIANLSTSFDNPSYVYITTSAAHAIKSRVAIYFGDWSIAKTECELVINSGDFTMATELNYVSSFGLSSSVNNKIFSLKSLSNDNNGIDGLANIYRGNTYGDINVLADLKNVFDPTDVRVKTTMINTVGGKLRNIGKYPTASPFNDNIIVIRYEEVLLNYAEALFRLNPSDPNALIELNRIPAKRLATPYTVINEDNILLERRKELCFEGFRFSDLARTGRNIPLVSPQQTHGGVTYGSYKYAFPIPLKELNANVNTVQNLGYN